MSGRAHPLKVLLLLVPGLGLIVVFIGTVVAMALAQSFGRFNFAGTSSWSLAFWRAQLASPLLWRSLFYSFRIALLGALFSVALAYPLALWLRKPFPGSGMLAALLKIPLLIPGAGGGVFVRQRDLLLRVSEPLAAGLGYHGRAAADAERSARDRGGDFADLEEHALCAAAFERRGARDSRRCDRRRPGSWGAQLGTLPYDRRAADFGFAAGIARDHLYRGRPAISRFK